MVLSACGGANVTSDDGRPGAPTAHSTSVAVLGDWSVAPSARFTPLAKLGRVVLAGMHLSG